MQRSTSDKICINKSCPHIKTKNKSIYILQVCSTRRQIICPRYTVDNSQVPGLHTRANIVWQTHRHCMRAVADTVWRKGLMFTI